MRNNADLVAFMVQPITQSLSDLVRSDTILLGIAERFQAEMDAALNRRHTLLISIKMEHSLIPRWAALPDLLAFHNAGALYIPTSMRWMPANNNEGWPIWSMKVTVGLVPDCDPDLFGKHLQRIYRRALDTVQLQVIVGKAEYAE